MLYFASADAPKDEAAQDDEEEDEEMECPARAVAGEVSPRASESSPSAAPAASSDPANISPASTPRLREVPDVQRRGRSRRASASFWGSISANTATKGYESASPMTQHAGICLLQGTSTLATSPPSRVRPLLTSQKVICAEFMGMMS